MSSMSRRTFAAGAGCVVALLALGGTARALDGENTMLLPPGAQDEERFRSLCIKCDRCRGVCPTDVVSVASVSDGLLNARLPKLDFHESYCTFCNECIEVCPTGALEAFDPAVDRIGTAVVDTESCIAYVYGECRRCDVCEYDALEFDEVGRPHVIVENCNGCGKCVNACVVNVYRSFSGNRNRAVEVVRS